MISITLIKFPVRALFSGSPLIAAPGTRGAINVVLLNIRLVIVYWSLAVTSDHVSEKIALL